MSIQTSTQQTSAQIKDYFYALADSLFKQLNADENMSCSFHGEETQFIRFNQSKVRQSTTVEQYSLSFLFTKKTKKQSKKLSKSINLMFDQKEDQDNCLIQLKTCQKLIDTLPEFSSVVEPQGGESSEQILGGDNATDDSLGFDGFESIEKILEPMQDVDMAGIFVSGPVYKGVSNSKGLKHWFSNNSFYLDYSMYSAKQRAVKGGYAGDTWDNAKYLQNLSTSKDLLSKMSLPVVNVPKGKHRVYLAPTAVAEIVGTMGWGAFSMGAYQKGYSPLKKLKDGEEQLSSQFTIKERFELGLTPRFNELGEVSNPVVDLISQGQLDNFLVSSQTAQEFGLESNYADSSESPRSPVIDPGSLKSENILKELDTGIYICNLHYLNWSDRMSARITGMTRFACLWVENGEIKGPIKDLRFDESIFNCFGENLEQLTEETKVIPETMTYSIRHIGGMRVPGMIVKDFNFTL